MSESNIDLETPPIERTPSTPQGKAFYSQNLRIEQQRQEQEGQDVPKGVTYRHAREKTALQLLNEREKKNKLLARDRSERDELTGLLNRRGFETRLREETQRAKRFHKPLTIIFMDLNNLKVTNDNESYLAGDKLIKLTGEILASTMREYDIAARWGGDEFGILLPGTGERDIPDLWERINQEFEKNKIDIAAGYMQMDYSSEATIIESQELCQRAMKAAKRVSKEEKRNVIIHPNHLSNEEILKIA